VAAEVAAQRSEYLTSEIALMPEPLSAIRASRKPSARLLRATIIRAILDLLRKVSKTMKLNTLKDLYIHELKDLYSAEKQIIKALPKMIKAPRLTGNWQQDFKNI
jgi:hypothetical protein